MNTAIILNLDYEQRNIEVCKRVWSEIEHNMLHAGFVKNNRLFLTNLQKDIACKQARAVVEQLDAKLANEGINLFDCIREFYGIDYQQINNLLAPANEAIEVDFMDTGQFKQYFTSADLKR